MAGRARLTCGWGGNREWCPRYVFRTRVGVASASSGQIKRFHTCSSIDRGPKSSFACPAVAKAQATFANP
eukprot:scaffold3422_cov28-Tisochrysis_lutea.AAC.3